MDLRTPVQFSVDQMLIKLGRYLRILGFDAIWDPAACTHDLIRRANAEGRVFLSRNHRIEAEYPHPTRWIHIESTNPVEQLRLVMDKLGLQTACRPFSRCIRCNVELQAVVDKGAIAARVHPNVLSRHDRFYTCPACGTVFWKGSHVRNTCRKLGLPADTA